MAWQVIFHDEFLSEVADLDSEVRRELLSMLAILEENGPMLGRPHADTLSGSRHANLKELRFNADGGVWRAAFAFDPKRRGVILVAANKSGVALRRFYASLIAKADARYDAYLAMLARKE